MLKLTILISVVLANAMPVMAGETDRSTVIARQYGVAAALAANCPNFTINETKMDAFLDAEGIHRADRVDGTSFHQTFSEAVKFADGLMKRSAAAKRNDLDGKQAFACKLLLEIAHRDDSLIEGFIDPK